MRGGDHPSHDRLRVHQHRLFSLPTMAEDNLSKDKSLHLRFGMLEVDQQTYILYPLSFNLNRVIFSHCEPKGPRWGRQA